eukprot:1190489-Prorocentrum_minimum.AAC.2
MKIDATWRTLKIIGGRVEFSMSVSACLYPYLDLGVRVGQVGGARGGPGEAFVPGEALVDETRVCPEQHQQRALAHLPDIT